MPESEVRTETVNVGSTKSYGFPVEMGRPLEAPPTGIGHTTYPSNIKEVPLGKSRILNKNSILAMHSLCLPRQEWLILGMRWYKHILAMVEKYDYDNEKEFFEVYPELIVAKESEDWSTASSAEFRYHRRMFISRLVNRLLGYRDAILALDGAFANLSILSNVNGSGRFKTFGLSCKWSYINSASNTFDDFIQPKGCPDLIGQFSKFCVGKTNQDTTFVSVPEWDSDIFGNRGQHSMNWSDVVASWDVSGDKFKVVDDASADYQTYHTLLRNMVRTITRYGYDISFATGPTANKHAGYIADKINPANDKCAVPSISHLENGAALSMMQNSVEIDTFAMNNDTSAIYKGFTGGIRGGEGSIITTDNIINRAWDTYNFWITYMQEFYSDVMQRSSVIRKFMLEYLPDDFEEGITNVKFYKKINADSAFDACDFQRKRMVYKRKGAATTATILRWEPLYCDAGENLYDGENFHLNFERIKFDADSEEEVLRTAKEHVRLTPTMFDSLVHFDTDSEQGTMTPTVANAIGSASYLIDSEDVDTPIHAPLGQFGAMLDRAMAYASKNPQNNALELIGAVPEDVQSEFVEPASNHSIVFDKDPENVWVQGMPIVDSTDIYQCGWNVIISDESENPNVWEVYFRNPLNYGKTEEFDEPDFGYTPSAGSGTSANPNSHNSPAFAMSSGKKNEAAHAGNPLYLSYVKHAKVFIGDAIWEIPESIPTRYQAGNYAESMVFCRVGSLEPPSASVDALHDFLVEHVDDWTVPSALTEDLLEDMSCDDLVQYLLALSACPNDPSIAADEIKYIMSPFHWYKAWWEKFAAIQTPETWQMFQFTFRPDYGPVVPVTYEIPAHLPAVLKPKANLANNETIADDTSDESYAIGPQVLMADEDKGDWLFAYHTEFALNSNDCPGQYLLWFLDNFKFSKTSKAAWDVYLSDHCVKLPGFSGPAKMAFALLCRGSVFHMGSKEFDSIYRDTDRMRGRMDDVKIDIVSIDMGNLVLPPKVVVKAMSSGKLSSWRDRGVSIKKVVSAEAYSPSQSAGKNETGGESPSKKQPLKADRFVDDVRYASAFAREKASLTGWGPVKIRFALRAKGIAEADIADGLAEIEEDRAASRLEVLLQNKWKSLSDDPQGRLKLIRFALSRGYEYSQVEGLIAQITK